MAFFCSSSHIPTSEVEISISCRSLLRKDVMSKSDPMCVIYIQPFGECRWVEHKRTEVIYNCHDPDFVTKVQMFYKFEELQPIKFEVYDVDSKSPNLRDHEPLGWANCSLAQIIAHGKVKLPLLWTGKSSGAQETGSYIVVSAEELATLKDEVIISFFGRKLDKKDFFGKSDPFLEIYKSSELGEFILVHRTEVVKNTLDPIWKECVIPVRSLCNGDYDRVLKVMCIDWNLNGDRSFIGEFTTTLRELMSEEQEKKFTLINEEKMARKRDAYRGSGELFVDRVELRPIYTFMDYIRGGTQVHCTFAIDFTASNGHPFSPDSLHFLVDGRLNCYEQAILSVGAIIEDYDSDKKFPVLGFGAKLPHGVVSDDFYVNFDRLNPYCYRVGGVLKAYRNCIRKIQLAGPTNFAPVVNHVAKLAADCLDGSNYFILLIITDGVITDMSHTCQAIVSASSLPMSIIIVGVGDADFSAMEKLDGDHISLSCGGVRAARDIVQFVPYNKCIRTKTFGIDPGVILAKELLAEIPQQFLAFMKSKCIVPGPSSSDPVVLPPDPEAVYSDFYY